ncbi:MAG TPA: hypothetical protein VLB47_13520, partial [Solirubrobacteraceae bacterium]|nr:hypothetical protein [Solirubrobacteraceae bacterium]
ARMRRAVNAALDRPALAARVPIPLGAPGRPTDQVIPPGVPGFRDVTVHPLGGPDLALARRLAGGARHRRAVLVTCNLPGCIEHGRVAKRNLAAIGIDLIVKNLNLDEMFERLHDPGAAWDLGYFNYYIDFADPANFVNVYRSGDEANIGGFRDRDLQRRIAAAARLTGADRLRTYAELDADLARAAASAPFATGASTDFFAARIGCQVQQPIYGISLGALCVRG